MPADLPWFHVPAPLADPALRLLCFPHAGGHAGAFSGWSAHLPPGVELRVAQLPGRGPRIAEPPVATLPALLEGLGPAARACMDRPVVLLGHSLGAFVAFSLARWLEDQGGPGPAHLVVLGQRAPHIPLHDPAKRATSDEAILADLRSLGGTPAAILDSPELMALLLPALRADYALSTGFHADPDEAVGCPITAVGAWDDADVRPADLAAWRLHTRAAFEWHVLEGDHFFLHQRTPKLLATLRPALRRAEARP